MKGMRGRKGKGMRKRGLYAGLIVAFIITFIVASPVLFVIHGYDGPVAEIVEIEHEYPSGIYPIVEIGDEGAYASVYPDTPDITDLFVATGLRMEIQAAPNVISQEVIDTLIRYDVDDAAKTNISTTVEVKKVKCDMKIHVATYNGGLASAFPTTFWIQLEDNAASVFTDAGENIVWITHVYTKELPIEEGSMEYIPTSKGYTFPLTTVSKHTVPQWLVDAGYQPDGELFEVVKFKIKMLSGVPVLSGATRIESYVTFDIGFDAILVGEWKQVHDYLEGGWPKLPDYLGDFLDKFGFYIILLAVVVIIVIFTFYFGGITKAIISSRVKKG